MREDLSGASEYIEIKKPRGDSCFTDHHSFLNETILSSAMRLISV